MVDCHTCVLSEHLKLFSHTLLFSLTIVTATVELVNIQINYQRQILLAEMVHHQLEYMRYTLLK